MDAPTITVQLPADLYAKLQSMATRERTELVEVLERLTTTEPQPFAGVIVKDPQMRGGRPIITGTGVTVRTVVGHYKLGLTPEEIAVNWIWMWPWFMRPSLITTSTVTR